MNQRKKYDLWCIRGLWDIANRSRCANGRRMAREMFVSWWNLVRFVEIVMDDLSNAETSGGGR